MFKSVSVLLISAMVLTSCGSVRDSAFNPFNWFGRSTSEPVATEGEVNPLIPRRKASIFRKEQDDSYRGSNVGEVSELLVERRPGGAIIRATGVTDYLGPFELKLVKLDDQSDADTLTYALRAYQPRQAVGGQRARTVTAATWLTDNELAGIREIRVLAERNSRVTRR
jgi:hypothetical protein